NARRFREARQLADLDALTSLHNRRYFHETLAREVARAQRYNRQLALIVFDLDDFKEINDRIGHLTGDSVLAEAAERVRGVVRSADVACRVGGDEFAVILPEASIDEADQLYHRIQEAVSSSPIGAAGRLYLSAGVAHRRLGLPAWTRPHPAFERQVDAILSLLDEVGGRATFFLLGITVANYPEVVARIAASGHEPACHGYAHVRVYDQTPEEFRS